MKWTALMLAGLAFAPWPSATAAATSGTPTLPSVKQRLATLPAPFVPNAGQWSDEAAFAAQTFAGILFVTTDGRLVYRLPGSPGRPSAVREIGAADSARAPSWVLTETLVDASGTAAAATPRGERPQAGRVGYLLGNDPRGHRDNVPTFGQVDLGLVYPGIRVQVRATGRNVEKIFTVAPRRDPAAIHVRVEGATGIEVGGRGQLVVHTGNGPVEYTAPIAYQEQPRGGRVAVDVRYALDAAGRTYGFTLGAYDTERPLVIDPLIQSTYLGGTESDRITALAIHPATGEVYVAGYTASALFPKTTGAQQSVYGGGSYDAFVTRFNPALTTRLQSTYLGGSAEDSAKALAIHPSTGEVYVAGSTVSDGFPMTAGSDQPLRGASYDGFVARLNASLTTILQSTYLGADDADEVKALAVHPVTGEVYAAGITYSVAFPKVAGGAQPAKSTGADAFVTRLNATLTSQLQSTYVGGNSLDMAATLGIHPTTGDVYIAGTTQSTDFPNVAGSEQTAHGVDGNTYDAFVTRLNALLTAHVQSTYLGGNGIDQASGLAIHPFTGEVYVTGYTLSNDFPKVAGSEQTARAAQDDAFVTRLPADLTTRLQSTYLGGSVIEQANAIAIHPYTGHVYVAGYSSSSDLPKVASGDQAAIGAGDDGFITQLAQNLTSRIQSTFLGGNGNEQIKAMAIHPASGEVYVAGETTSTNLNDVSGAEQTANAGIYDGFVGRVSRDLRALDIYPDAYGFAPKMGVPVGSMQTSAPTQITGIGAPVTVALNGGNYAQFCISSTLGCGCDVQAYTITPTAISAGQYVCVRQFAPFVAPASAQAMLAVGTGFATFFVATGNGLSACSLDVDGNGALDALTDGLIVIRALFGLTGTSVTNGAVGQGATRADWTALRSYLNGNCGSGFAP